jgi:DNA-binding NarL/FixJ family response regulator
MREPITVLLADPHGLVRKGLRRLLEDDPGIRVVGEAANGAEAVARARELRPDAVVMDVAMPEMDGIQATREILHAAPQTAVVLLGLGAGERYVRQAFAAGARGYLLKSAPEVDLPGAIREAAAGRTVLSPGLALPSPGPGDDYGRLTQRERQVLQLIVQGKSSREIARLLGLSVNTIAVHRANLMQALGARRTADLVVSAIRKGLVAIPRAPGE